MLKDDEVCWYFSSTGSIFCCYNCCFCYYRGWLGHDITRRHNDSEAKLLFKPSATNESNKITTTTTSAVKAAAMARSVKMLAAKQQGAADATAAPPA